MTATHMSPGFVTARPPIRSGAPSESTRLRTRTRGAIVGLAAAAALAIGAIVLFRAPVLTGTYGSVDTAGSMEFRGSKVYITTVLGTTFVSTYEVDGNRVVIKGAGGAQVYTRNGATLDGGVGMKFVKRSTQTAETPTTE